MGARSVRWSADELLAGQVGEIDLVVGGDRVIARDDDDRDLLVEADQVQTVALDR